MTSVSSDVPQNLGIEERSAVKMLTADSGISVMQYYMSKFSPIQRVIRTSRTWVLLKHFHAKLHNVFKVRDDSGTKLRPRRIHE